jgi:hypothetical protein
MDMDMDFSSIYYLEIDVVMMFLDTTDGRTEGPTDQPTNMVTHRVTCTRLKTRLEKQWPTI